MWNWRKEMVRWEEKDFREGVGWEFAYRYRLMTRSANAELNTLPVTVTFRTILY